MGPCACYGPVGHMDTCVPSPYGPLWACMDMRACMGLCTLMGLCARYGLVPASEPITGPFNSYRPPTVYLSVTGPTRACLDRSTFL